MEAKDKPEDKISTEKTLEQNIIHDLQPVIKTSRPSIAGVLLIIAGVILLLSIIQIFTLNDSDIQSMYSASNSQFAQFNTTITLDQFKQSLTLCETMGIIIVIFSLLGGILSLKRKIWGLALIAAVPQSLLGIIVPGFSFLFVSGLLSLLGLLLIAFSRKEFQ